MLTSGQFWWGHHEQGALTIMKNGQSTTSTYTNIRTQISWPIFTVVNLSQKLVQRMEKLTAYYDLNSDKFKTNRLAVGTRHTLYFKNCTKCFYPLFSSQHFEGCYRSHTGRKKARKSPRLPGWGRAGNPSWEASESCDNGPEPFI